MKLPNADRALVARDKVERYLLDPAHPDNGGKATFFLTMGYNRGDWPSLAAAPREVAMASEVTSIIETVHGTKYVVDGALGPALRNSATVRTIWIIDRGQDVPRLVTAYPREG